jgi:hypothetical protein
MGWGWGRHLGRDTLVLAKLYRFLGYKGITHVHLNDSDTLY